MRHSSFSRSPLWLIAHALMAMAWFACGGTASAADWFVAPGAPTGDGSRQKPFHDPWRALEVAAPGDRIHIAEGTYLGRHDRSAWEVDRPSLTLLGGYNAGFAVRNPWKHPTVLAYNPDFEGTNESNLLVGRGNHNGVIIDGLVFDGSGRNTYDSSPPRALQRSLSMVGHLLSVASAEVTVRNCVFLNSRTGAVEARGPAFRFENNLLLNHLGQPVVTLRDPAGTDKRPATIKSNTFAFALDDSDPPMGKGGEKGTALRVACPTAIDSNVFIGCGNQAISIFTQAERVSIDRNVFWLSLRAHVSAREGGKEAVIGEKNLEEMEDLGLKSAAGNTTADVAFTGLGKEWVDAVTHHLLVAYASPPKEALAKLRASYGLPETPSKEGRPEGGVMAPLVEVTTACAVGIRSDAGARPVELTVDLAAATPPPPPATYERVHWAELATGNPGLNGRRVEVRVAMGNERNGFVLKDTTAEKHLGFDVMHPGGESLPEQLHVYATRYGLAHRQWEQSAKSNNPREVEDWYLLRGIYRVVEGGRQKATLEVEQIVSTEPPPKPKVTRPQGRDWFVRAGATGGDGTREKPFRDPFQALEKAEGGDAIHVAGGDYFGKLRSASWKISVRNLSLIGGYDTQFATRDPWKHSTRLMMSPDVAAADKAKHPVKFLETTIPADGLVVDGFVFDGASINNYHDAAAGGALKLGNTPIGPMVQLIGGPLTVRNCVFANACGAAADLSGAEGVFENNVIVNTSGTGLNILANGPGPWVVRGNTFLFAADPTARAGSGRSTAAGSLMVLRGRCAARVERNLFGFADNYAIRATTPRQKLMLDQNAFVGNAYCHYTDANLVWLHDATWDRRLADSGLGSARDNVRQFPQGVALDRKHLDLVLPRLFNFKGRYDTAGWASVAASAGASVKPATEAGPAPATQPKPAEKPKEQSLDDLMAELNKIKTEIPAEVEAPKGPPYCPAYQVAKAMELAGAESTTVGARRVPLTATFTGATTAEGNKTYQKITFEQVATGRDALAGQPVEFDAKPPRSAGSGGTPPADLSADLFTGYVMQTTDGSHPRLPITIFVRRDSAASRVMERSTTTDTVKVRGMARVLPNYRGLVVVADSLTNESKQ